MTTDRPTTAAGQALLDESEGWRWLEATPAISKAILLAAILAIEAQAVAEHLGEQEDLAWLHDDPPSDPPA